MVLKIVCRVERKVEKIPLRIWKREVRRLRMPDMMLAIVVGCDGSGVMMWIELRRGVRFRQGDIRKG